jgi:hypothetical protein
MAKLIADMSVSLDGFIADATPRRPTSRTWIKGRSSSKGPRSARARE